MSDSSFDIIVFGATSFVGRILCEYLVENYGISDTVSWAAAGRSQKKLESLKRSLGARANELPLLVADALSDADMTALCNQAGLVMSTVGPYALYGEPLVRACAETGTDYLDLTGEAHWVKEMLDRYETQAQESGARIVPCCGFDSIPSDMGVWHLQKHARERFGQNCNRVSTRVKAAKGGPSGGSIATVMNVVKEAARDSSLRRQMADPYSLCPGGTKRNPKQRSIMSAKRDTVSGGWIAPFVMATINERIVLRSNAFENYADNFRYDEAVMAGRGVRGALAANGIVAAMGAFAVGVVIPPSRWALEKFVLPSPGEGPTPEAQKNGYFDFRLFGRTPSGQTIKTKVTGDRDPGYGSTAKMLAETGMCLVTDMSKDEKPGGLWTTASIFDERLIERLTQNAGLSFEVLA